MEDNSFFQHPVGPRDSRGSYGDFDATELYCPNCRRAVPVSKRLLLVLPDGEKHEYRCRYCAASVGSKIERKERKIQLIY